MLGVCYYPEHWPQNKWAEDARQMVDLGLTCVRIGEFAWSRLEPKQGELTFDWLDKAIDTLGGAGLKVVMGTPTATPPKWLVDKWPEVLPVDPATGSVRGFGSRRHYDFSSKVYLRESLRITELLVKRYGANDAVVGWQTDNEICAHETAVSASKVALEAFRVWCEKRYGDVDTLNKAWGNVFWSMEYNDFADIELPFQAVTEVNPAHSLAYKRFSSDQVVHYHDQMVGLIRSHAPDKFITHNFIPFDETQVDNFAICKDLDFASYDSYPLGRTDMQFSDSTADTFRPYMRTGHPDLATYYHDQARGLTGNDFWIMEQQPGPVNWAPSNTRPAAGMVRFWTLEAFAHGGACVSYFRWRQAPFAQEQMHAGLLRPDDSRSETWSQIEEVSKDIERLNVLSQKTETAKVAIITGAEQFWVTDIERQSDFYDCDQVQLSYYSALRKLGLNIDFISKNSDFAPYDIIIAPCLPVIDEALVEKCSAADALFVFGPRSGAKTREFGYAKSLPPGPLQSEIPIKILSVETIRADCSESFLWNGKSYVSRVWREEIQLVSGAPIQAEAYYQNSDGLGEDNPVVVRSNNFVYIGTLTCEAFLTDFFEELCREAGVKTYNFGDDIRIRQRGELIFAFNYSAQSSSLNLPEDREVLLGDTNINPRGVTVWRA